MISCKPSDGSENLHKHIELIQQIKMLIKDSKHKLISNNNPFFSLPLIYLIKP